MNTPTTPVYTLGQFPLVPGTYNHVYTAEASSLGLKANEWPQAIKAHRPSGQPVTFKRHDRMVNQATGDLDGYRYVSEDATLILKVWND